MTRRNLTLLVVEDEALIAMDLEDMLEDLGHRVIEVAGSPAHALALLERCIHDLDAVLLDANLGGESALPVARRLHDGNVPFVITSGYEEHELLREGFDAPLVSKPYRSAEIDQALQAAASG